MSGRLIPVLLLLLFLGLILGLMSIPFIARDATPTVSQSTPLRFKADLGAIAVDGTLVLAPDGGFDVLVRLVPARRGIANPPIANPPIANPPIANPIVVLAMPDHAMTPVMPAMVPLGGGRFAASGRFPMGGRWDLRVAVRDDEITFPFHVEE